MKTCPLCGAAAADTATTCFECLYSFATMSARTSTLAESECRSMEPVSRREESAPASDRDAGGLSTGNRDMTFLLSDDAGRRALVRARRGPLFVGSDTGRGRRTPDLSVHRSDEGDVVVEQLSRRARASLNGGALAGSGSLALGDRVQLGALCMTLVSSGGARADGQPQQRIP